MPLDLTQELPVLFDDLAAEVVGFVRPVGLIRNGVTVAVGRGYKSSAAPSGTAGLNQQLPAYGSYDYFCEFTLEGPAYNDRLTVDGVEVLIINSIDRIQNNTAFYGLSGSEPV